MWGTLISMGSSLLGGRRCKFLGLLLAGVVLSTLFGWLLWAKAYTEADLERTRRNLAVIQSAYTASTQAVDDLRAEISAQSKALIQREKTIQTISRQREAFRLRWQEALRHDHSVKDWANTALPDAVRGLLN